MSIPFIYERFDTPTLIFRDQLFCCEITSKVATSIGYFGGVLKGFSRDSLDEDIHHLMMLDLSSLGMDLSQSKLSITPFLYGFIYDSCQMKYQIGNKEIPKVTHFQPIQKYANFPYSDYPSTFPVSQITLSKTINLTEELIEDIFLDRKEMPELTNQILVVVPPNPKYGVSLWGDEGDAEHVQVVFLVDLINNTITVENQCS
ncbi:MAG: hypothetical protein RLZZ156_123 [Deinococcota bacterium]|jgi:hypothetical protein